jgi:stress response protein YsnF
MNPSPTNESPAAASPDEASAPIAVTEEQLHVGRRVSETGHGLRVRKHVEEVPVEAQASVVHEFVDVERVRVDRVVDVAPALRQEGDVTVVPVVEERLVTRKELVLVEEIRLTRRREETPAHADLTLRRERVVVERLDPASGRWQAEDAAPAPFPQPKEQ